MTALNIQHVVKRHGDLETVSDVSLNVEAGERVALLGHNGAGKTTIIKARSMCWAIIPVPLRRVGKPDICRKVLLSMAP